MHLLVAALAALVGFATPDDNIHCVYLPRAENLVCAMRSAHYGTTMDEDCQARTGFAWIGWRLYRSRSTLALCAPNYPWRGAPAYTTLHAGGTWRHGIFHCSETRSALTCRSSSGHGLYVAFDSWRAW